MKVVYGSKFRRKREIYVYQQDIALTAVICNILTIGLKNC